MTVDAPSLFDADLEPEPDLTAPLTINDDTTIAEARRWLEAHRGAGVTCPTCDKYVKVYRRPMPAVAALSVLLLRTFHGMAYAHLPRLYAARAPGLAHQGGYKVLGVHWGIIEEELATRPDGGRAGYWSVTDVGALWMDDEITLPSHVLLAPRNRVLGFDGDPITFRDALASGAFDLREIMRPVE